MKPDTTGLCKHMDTFKCVECGNVFDLNIQLNPESIPDLDGYEIKEQHVYIKGVCTKCQKSDHIN